MSATLILGLQWGDEGKGKIVDVLSKDADLVCRFQGGHNAGHTLKVDNEKKFYTSYLQVFSIQARCASLGMELFYRSARYWPK